MAAPQDGQDGQGEQNGKNGQDKRATPWAVTVQGATLVVSLPVPYRVLSWAPLNPGLVEARTIINHHVNSKDPIPDEPAHALTQHAQQLHLSFPVVGLMTGVSMERLVRQTEQLDALTLECCATVGLSNALTVGDPATHEERPGTINLIVVLDHPLTSGAMVEAISLVTEAKLHALHAADVRSTVSHALATGTGTDCIAIACPPGKAAYHYCGKHTRLGELLGRVVSATVSEGIDKTQTNG